jgi:hypothetical protein
MASGNTLVIFHPYNNEPPAANYATLDLRNYHPVLDFDPTTNESAIFSAVMPQSYSAATGVTVHLFWMATSDTTDTHHVYWDAAFERDAPNDLDLDSDSFAAVQSNDITHVNATSGKITETTIALTAGAQMDSVVAGDLFRLQITRDAANDDATGDAELLAVEIRET